MNSDFDKEIDFLLRSRARTAENPRATVFVGEHLEPDDLAAFAENSLPPAARQRFAAHLADCADCRQTLSSLILINEIAAEESAVETTKIEKTVEPTRVSWLESFKQIFAFPTFGYATAALAVLLFGTVAFVALRNPTANENATVAQLQPNNETAKPIEQPISQPAAATLAETKPQSPALAAAEPTAAPAENRNTATTTADSAQPQTNNSNSAASEPPSVKETRESANSNRSDAAANQPAARSAQTANQSAPVNANAAPNLVRQRPNNQTAAETRAPRSTSPPPSADAEVARKPRSERDENAEEKSPDLTSIIVGRVRAESPPPLEKREVAGKTFQKNYDKAWQDKAYKGQAAQTIQRGSKDYKKLPAAVRSIAERLGGEVIVVWQGKTYRIR